MAEEGSVYELEGLEKQLQSLLRRYSSDELRADSKAFCSDFGKLVEEYASRWQVPLPQLRILEKALCYFTRASTFFTLNCDHVLHTLSSLALSVFELLLFFDQEDFHQEPLKHFTVTFQECHLALARHQNVHLLQVERLVQGGGPWASPVLQAILSESSLPQSEADGCVSSELPVFFELRVRYLLSCERISEAMALAKCCAQHPSAGQHLFFLQVYLAWLFKTSQHDRLHKEVVDLNGKDAVQIICSLECEEKDELLLALCRAFLSQQLCRGDMYYLCDLVFIWSKLHHRLSTSKQALLEETRQLMLSAINVSSIFPFIRAILQELGEEGIQFCVELCANALECCLSCDVITKSLIYKTIAGLLPDDLEVCRACALLVFFLERTVEAYKMVYLLYMHPDQEYHVEYSPIRNHTRFETLQVLKKDLYFDPEFWNLIALRTNCLKLMSEKVVSAALEEIMEDKWILNYCTKEPGLRSSTSACKKGSKKRHRKEDSHHKDDANSKRLKLGPGKTRLNADHTAKKKGNQGSRPLRDASSEPLRRSFWQLDRLQDSVAHGHGELRRTTRLSEKNPPKRRIRQPKWLLQDSGTLAENNVHPKIKKHGLKHQKHHQSSVVKRSDTGEMRNIAKNNAKQKPSVNSHLMTRENNSRHQKELSLDCVKPTNPPQVILELSLPDNELMGTFIEDTCNRQRGFPQVLLYKPTVKLPATSQAVKTVHRKEVILRARDTAMFIQQLHCYVRRQKGKGNGPNIQGSVSTITRSSVQGSPPKDLQRELCETPASHTKGGTPPAAEVAESSVLEKGLRTETAKAVSRKTSTAKELCVKPAEIKATNASQTLAAIEAPGAPTLDKFADAPTIASARDPCEESAVEMKVTFASQTPPAAKLIQSQGLDEVCQSSKTTASAEVVQTSGVDNTLMVESSQGSNTASISDISASFSMSSQLQGDGKTPTDQAKLDGNSEVNVTDALPKVSKGHVPGETNGSRKDQDTTNDMSALTLVTEMVTELSPAALGRDLDLPEQSPSKKSTTGSKYKVPYKLCTPSDCSVPELGASAVNIVQRKKDGPEDFALKALENNEDALPETEESKLEYPCTFCSKVFKGSRVVAHAMFHYRKDECMFCGTMFKDDLLAMMHLSDHIEKLKKSKESAGKQAQENSVSETKDISTPKTSSKAKPTNRSIGRRADVCPKSTSLPDSTVSGSRKLRSNDKPADGPSLQGKKQTTSKHLHNKTPAHKVNGHVVKKEDPDGPKEDPFNSDVKQPLTQQSSLERAGDGAKNVGKQENQEMETCATSTVVEREFSCLPEDKATKAESPLAPKTAAKMQDGKAVEDKNAESRGKLCCPVDGCAWFTDASKNRVAFLYHTLDAHRGEVKPLEAAFRVGNGRCGICMRVLWSFKHFQHHVERHRLTPRHPCLHQGCTARFKTGMEMRRHTRRHSPLQAVCCLPGCPQLFICLWALNLHERAHYASRPAKLDRNPNEPKGNKHGNTETGKKQLDHNPKDETKTTAVNKSMSAKAARKLRRKATHSSATGKPTKAPPQTAVRPSLLKRESRESSDTKDLHVLKNLSNKDTSTQPAGPNLRLRQTLRKVQVTNKTMAGSKTHKVMPSSLLKHKIKMRHKIKKKQVKLSTKGPKRRGRPPKSKKAVRDENATAVQKSETVQRTASQKDQKRANPTKAAETNLKEEMSLRGEDAAKTEKVTAERMKKLQKAKKRCAPEQDETVPSDSRKSKKQKVTNSKAKTEVVKKKDPDSATKKPAKSKSLVSQVEAKAAAAAAAAATTTTKVEEERCADEDVKAKEENKDTTQNSTDDSVAAVPTNSLTEITAVPGASGEKAQTVRTEETSKKSHITEKEGAPASSSSDSGETSLKHQNVHKEGDKKGKKERQARKDLIETPLVKKTTKSASSDQWVRAEMAVKSSEVEDKANEGTSDAAVDISGASIPVPTACSSDETTFPPAAAVVSVQKATKKEKSKNPHVSKISDPNKANKKRKDIQKDSNTKTVKKTCKDPSKKPLKSKTEPAEVKAEAVESSPGEEGKTAAETPPCPKGSSGYSVITNGQASREDAKSAVCKDTLAEYSKKPYMRLPPTAYLDEKYITMPKRRKEVSFLQPAQQSPLPEQPNPSKAVQRQRCANCFATFNSTEDLQSHLQLQKCSNLFGFDSDDEGNS